MRIAIVTEVFLPKIDGVVTRLTRTLDQLAAMGHEVRIFATGKAPATYAGFEVTRIP
ncbi:glycosyltransferase family 1 protein, partial [Corynebacterium hesseae]